jgi:hypothetical protein
MGVLIACLFRPPMEGIGRHTHVTAGPTHQYRSEIAMPILFAHHGMLERLDIFHFHPTTIPEHIEALVIYALLIAGLARAAWIGWASSRAALKRRRLRQAGGNTACLELTGGRS